MKPVSECTKGLNLICYWVKTWSPGPPRKNTRERQESPRGASLRVSDDFWSPRTPVHSSHHLTVFGDISLFVLSAVRRVPMRTHRLALRFGPPGVVPVSEVQGRIAIFNYPGLNLGVGIGDCGDETANLRSIVWTWSATGHSIVVEEEITSFSQSDFSERLWASDVFIMPEIQIAFIFPSTSAESLKSFVQLGGTLMIFSDSGMSTGSVRGPDFLNLIFDWDLAYGTTTGDPWIFNDNWVSSRTPPSSLHNQNRVQTFSLGTTGATAVYGTSSNAAVFRKAVGSGQVWGLGFDFFDAGWAATTTGSRRKLDGNGNGSDED